MIPAVYRNARYEARLDLLEGALIHMQLGLRALGQALEQLAMVVHSQQEVLLAENGQPPEVKVH